MKNKAMRCGTGVRLMALLLMAALLMGSCFAVEPEELKSTITNAENAMVEQAGLPADATLLDKQDGFPAGSSICDWAAIAFALNGRADCYDVYLDALESYVTDQYAQNGGLDRTKATEWHRIALTVLALGGDPTAFGTDAEGQPVNLIADGTYNFFAALDAQGTNGLIFALITLDANNYTVPEGSANTRESILAALLAAQSSDGGFGLSKESSDVDITAMALCALAPYKQDADVAAAIDAALSYLSGVQTENGGFFSYDVETSESASQVIIALSALGIDPQTDERFIKNGVSVYDALMSYQSGSGFVHTKDEAEAGNDVMATEQAVLALTAMRIMQENGGRLYDFTNCAAPESAAPSQGQQAPDAEESAEPAAPSAAPEQPETEQSGSNIMLWVAGGAAVVLIAAIIALTAGKNKKK